jgi:hypothetical protein
VVGGPRQWRRVPDSIIVPAIKERHIEAPDPYRDDAFRVLAARNQKPLDFFWPIGPIILFPVTTRHFLTRPIKAGIRTWVITVGRLRLYGYCVQPLFL